MKTLNLKVKTLVAAGPDPSQNGDPEQDNSIKYGTNEGEPQEDPSIAPRKGECPVLKFHILYPDPVANTSRNNIYSTQHQGMAQIDDIVVRLAP